MTPQLDWLLLTKRPQNADQLWRAAAENATGIAEAADAAWLPNIWLGTTVEDQRRADERIPHLLRVPAAVRFLSCEPLLEDVDLTEHIGKVGADGWTTKASLVDWVIVGGESGHHARPFDIGWARDIVSQCRDARVAPFVKQLGALPQDHGTGLGWPDGVSFREGVGPGSRVVLRDPKGGDMSEWPADLRVREFPASAVKS